MRSILKTLRPESIENILNGKQTVIVCKSFKKDYVGWIYLCCSKCSKKNYHLIEVIDTDIPDAKSEYEIDYYIGGYKGWQDDCLDGKVCARFWCDKVEEIKLEPVEDYSSDTYEYMTETLDTNDLLEKSCLHILDFSKYLHGKKGYAVYISKLEIFKKPRKLSEFYNYHLDEEIDKLMKENETLEYPHLSPYIAYNKCRLTKVPSNYCYIEGEE